MKTGHGSWFVIFICALCAWAQDTASSSSTLPSAPYDTIAGDLPAIVVAGEMPYYVVGDIYVPPGKTVRIQAGAVFLFKNFTGMQIQGKLTVEGMEEKPVVFTSENDGIYKKHESPDAAPFDWNGIYVHKAAIGTEVMHSHVLYSVDGLVAQTRFLRLHKCRFKNNGRTNLIIEGVEHDVGDEPYTYEITIKEANLEGAALAVLRDPLAPRRNVLRYSSVAVALGGAALGIVFSSNYTESTKRFESVSSTDPNNLSENSSVAWFSARSQKRRDVAGMLAGWGLLVIGGVGFTVSFTF